MSYVQPPDFVSQMIAVGEKKMFLSTRDTLVRAFMGAAILTLGAAMAVTITTNTGNPLLGAIFFPIGFVMLYLMGFDLLTGVFTLLPFVVLARRPGATWRAMLRNWGLVFVGNFAGAFTVAVLIGITLTYGFSTPPNEVGEALGHIGEGRTVGYADHGAAGMLTLFVRGVLCNWMVSTGVVAFLFSKDTISKAIVMWMPVFLFFYMGFEHSVVNMFLFPSGLLLGGDFTIMDYLVWNEIPTVLGNLVGGLTFVGLPLYLTHYRTKPSRRPVVAEPAPTDAPSAAPDERVATPVG